MTKRSSAVLALCASLLAGCVETGPAPSSSPDAGPGSAAADATLAAAMFAQVCTETAPNLDAARNELASMPFTQNSTTGTYYHRNLDLSFKVRREGGKNLCSIVFGTRDDALMASIMLQAAGEGSAAKVEVRDAGRLNGRQYVAAFAVSKP